MTREEAIKIVRNIYQTDAEKEALAILIPELAESEDERIIKTLQEYVKNRNWPLNGPTQAEVLAWLEKKKEPKPVEWEWPNLSNCIKNCKKCHGKCFYRKEPYEEQKPSIFPPGLGEVHWNPIPSAKKELTEKAAEKLSKEEYVKKFKALCDSYEIKLPNREYDIYGLCEDLHKLFGDIQKSAERNKVTINGEPISTENHSVGIPLAEWNEDIIQKAVKEVGLTQHQINWFKTNVFPPKQEWSEEDKEALDMCIDAIPKAWKTKSGILLTKWLKDNIHLQSKQEWNDEDEKLLNKVEALLNDYCDFLEDESSRFIPEVRETISRLKSLRHSWQPSKEQMEVDLKEETKEWVNLMVGASFPEQDGDFISEEDYRSVIRQTALHFYELGKNSK